MDHHGINNTRYGAKLTTETKKLISIGNIGKLKGRISPLLDRLHSKEHNKKISESTSRALLAPGMRSKLQSMLGKHHTEESKQKLRISNIGQKRSEEFKRNMSILSTGRPSGFKGKKHTIYVRIQQSNRAISRLINHKGPYKDTKPELMLKGMLIDLGFGEIRKEVEVNEKRINFIHQHYIDIEHAYVADFVFPKIKVVIEEDGVYFHKDKREQDNIRTVELGMKGYKVLRVTDQEVLKNYINTKNKIKNFVIGCEFDKILRNIGSV
jgi:very-short-patch-repair endonuclease